MTKVKGMHVIITGRVQGVFFRSSMQQEARALGVCGWVRNLPDGSVEAVVEGESEHLSAMLDWCRKGPPRAVVRHVEAVEKPSLDEFTDFTIRY